MVSVIVLVTPAPPCVAVIEAGAAESVKFLTVKLNVVVRVKLPFVPVTVMGYVPPAVVAGTTNVNVLVPEPVIEVGLKLAVAFVGRPPMVRAVAPVRPAVAVNVMVPVAFVPAAVAVTVPELDSENPSETTRVIGADCVRLDLFPVALKL